MKYISQTTSFPVSGDHSQSTSSTPTTPAITIKQPNIVFSEGLKGFTNNGKQIKEVWNEELTKEEEEKFYKKVFKTNFI
jgi:hypothetical protein